MGWDWVGLGAAGRPQQTATCLGPPQQARTSLPYAAGTHTVSRARRLYPHNPGGLQRVKASKALRCFVPIFSSKQYVKALQVGGA